MGETRGNLYSRGHQKYNDSQSEYWNFSSDELALYDTPAFIDRVLEESEFKKVTIVGFSIGNTNSFIGASLKPDYFEPRVNLIVALGPVVQIHSAVDGLGITLWTIQMMGKFVEQNFGLFNHTYWRNFRLN